MNAFASLSDVTRAFFALWMLLLCLTAIGSTVLSTVKRRLWCTIGSLLLFAPVYYLWQVIFDLSLFGVTQRAAAVCRFLVGLPWLYWLSASAVLTAALVILLRYLIRYDRTHIVPGSIKRFLDGMPCGICCWRENGRVLFSNICMNRLCSALTGGMLLNGNQFRDAVSDGILTAEGRVWRFSCREMNAGGERLYEMIASDVTAEYARTETLKKDQQDLARLNRDLSDYYHSIDDTVRRQEILQAKMNIHDEMNRLMLSTAAADREDTAALDGIFALWEQNALLLCMQADKKTGRQQKDAVDSLARALGIQVSGIGDLPQGLTDRQKELFYITAQEAIINAVKHAQAKEMRISFESVPGELRCRFANDGALPSGEVRFSGGLQNLSRLASQQGAALSAASNGEFVLTLSLPIGENQPIDGCAQPDSGLQ